MPTIQCLAPDCERPRRKRGMCQLHYRRVRKFGGFDLPHVTVEDRFWAKVQKTDGCWYWLGSKAGGGYGEFWIEDGKMPAHRFAWELLNGPIPDGLRLDHVCHNEDRSCPGGSLCAHRACVNPDHLEPVTHRENVRRGCASETLRLRISCARGHPYTTENTYITKRGTRSCRECLRIYRRRYEAKLSGGE